MGNATETGGGGEGGYDFHGRRDEWSGMVKRAPFMCRYQRRKVCESGPSRHGAVEVAGVELTNWRSNSIPLVSECSTHKLSSAIAETLPFCPLENAAVLGFGLERSSNMGWVL
jgi:hypothetical protein